MAHKVLISEEQLKNRVPELGAQISEDYKDKSIICVGILKGSCIFLADLVREITVPVTIDFMSVSSYGNSTNTSGEVKMQLDLKQNIRGKHVLIIEDIIDTGLTMRYLLNLLNQREPASIAVCSLLLKHEKEGDTPVIPIKYIGFDIPKSAFVIGYGLDFAEQYRNLKNISIYQSQGI